MGETSHLTAAPVLQAFHKGDFLHRGENAAQKNLNQIDLPTLEGKMACKKLILMKGFMPVLHNPPPSMRDFS